MGLKNCLPIGPLNRVRVFSTNNLDHRTFSIASFKFVTHLAEGYHDLVLGIPYISVASV